jgi:hypothetical protein
MINILTDMGERITLAVGYGLSKIELVICIWLIIFLLGILYLIIRKEKK